MASNAKAGPGKAQKKGRSAGGRTTVATPSVQSRRYTPPIAKSTKTSPKWMGILIIVMFLLGVLVVILNYAGLLPGGVNNLWLVAAIGAIFAGLILATRYH
jgi:Cell division protein CrgA